MDAIRATLDAAYIQGTFGFAGALIGALALIISIRVAAKNTINEIKLEKVAESKRDQYISLTESYTQYLVSSLTIRPGVKNELGEPSVEAEEIWQSHLSKYIEFVACINKVNLITTSEIRLELYKLQQELTSYQTSVANFYFNSHSLDSGDILQDKVFAFAKLLREDLGVESDSKLENNLLKLRTNERFI